MIDLRNVDAAGAVMKMKDVQSLSPFAEGLEYSAPARGPWNIVHVGMLVPESHEIFVCAQGCLRGVVLTAAEMNASERFSTITVQENNVLKGDLEELIIEGTVDILTKLPKLPRAALVYTSCIDHFIGCDLDYVYKTLRKRMPQVDFIDCYMTPIYRKKKITPDAQMRIQLYGLLQPMEKEEKTINVIGNLEPFYGECELLKMLADGGWQLRDISYCKDYDSFLDMASSVCNLVTDPICVLSGQKLEKRLGQKLFYLPLSYDYDEIDEGLETLSQSLGLPLPDLSCLRQKAEAALAHAKEAIGDLPISIDYTATTRPLGLARLLLSHGFQVVSLYADSFPAAEKENLEWVRENAPELPLHATMHSKMAVLPRKLAEEKGGKLLAIGQKAAYFTGTDYFVNILSGGGLYGYEGIVRLAGLMEEGAAEKKDTKSIIQVKGWGCCG